MRKDALRLCEYAVYGLENEYLDNPEREPVTLEEAVNICYGEFVDAADGNRGARDTKAAFFDTTEAIKKELERVILQNEYIKLKTR